MGIRKKERNGGDGDGEFRGWKENEVTVRGRGKNGWMRKGRLSVVVGERDTRRKLRTLGLGVDFTKAKAAAGAHDALHELMSLEVSLA